MKKNVFLKENRLSLKIFAHKLKKLSPQAYYIFIFTFYFLKINARLYPKHFILMVHG